MYEEYGNECALRKLYIVFRTRAKRGCTFLSCQMWHRRCGGTRSVPLGMPRVCVGVKPPQPPWHTGGLVGGALRKFFRDFLGFEECITVHIWVLIKDREVSREIWYLLKERWRCKLSCSCARVQHEDLEDTHNTIKLTENMIKLIIRSKVGNV